MATNKVVFGDRTVMDITDTTAETADVASGKDFYDKSGNKVRGTADYMAKVSNPTADNVLTTDNNGQAQDSGVGIEAVKNIFIAKQDTTTAAELIAAYRANKIIAVVPSGIATNYAYFATNCNVAGSNRCQLACIMLNGMTLSGGLTIVLWDVNGSTWNFSSQRTQNFLTQGDGIDITNNIISGTKMDASKGSTQNSVEVVATNGTSIALAIGDDIILTTLSPGLFTEQKILQEKLNAATEAAYGLVKLNPSENVTLNADGQLDVGGRLGQMPNSTGIYAPKTIRPAAVGDGSLLLTEGSGTSLGPKSLGVVTGRKLTCRSAAAGATEYRLQNTYANRIEAAALRISGGVLSLNEAQAAAGNFVNVLSVKINGADFIPDSSANSSSTADDIVITTDGSVNPTAATTEIRLYPASLGFSTVYAGQGIAAKNGFGASVQVGQGVVSNSGNANNLVGATIYNAGNGNTIVGRLHISKKNRWLMAGTGHDNSNGKSESGVALGDYSLISSDTAFVIGNGTSHTNRSNLFEIKTNGDIYKNGVKVL